MAVQSFQMVAGISLNGNISDESGSFESISSVEDREWLQKKIQESDVLIMGRKTFQKHVGSKPTKKPCIVFTRQIKGIVIASPHIHWFHDSKQELMNLCDVLQYKTITVLGGSEIYHWFLEQGILTDVYLTVEPVLASGGIQLLDGKPFHQQKKWKLQSTKVLNKQGSLLLHYHL